MAEVKREVKILETCKHANVVQYYGAYEKVRTNGGGGDAVRHVYILLIEWSSLDRDGVLWWWQR